ncbi:MAG: 23S rRNA (adenine(2503)-C(2))-methyltransferase RlmN [bacterium]|nr:23S rRNA (adenine(2503)-C(2))-methyltransferase RlmN [bacterium]
MKILQDYSIDEINEWLASLGEPKFRAKQIFEWAHLYVNPDQMTNLSKELRERIANEFITNPITIAKEFKSADGTVKFLYKLTDGELIEGVLMNYKYGNTLCVSTQVGCRMGCSFCASGLEGLTRNLTAGEILGQVLCVNSYLGGTLADRKITNIVLMGSGEPLDNYDNVVKFIRLVSAPEGINISQRNISLSTCGLADKIRKLTDENLTITLTLSLHATEDETRKRLMRVANAYSLSEVMDSIRYYYNKTKRRVVFEYIMLKDNTTHADALRLKALLSGLNAHVNLIPANLDKNSTLEGITKVKQTRFWQALHDAGVSATTRRTLGSDIEGACGQLKRRHAKEGL